MYWFRMKCYFKCLVYFSLNLLLKFRLYQAKQLLKIIFQCSFAGLQWNFSCQIKLNAYHVLAFPHTFCIGSVMKPKHNNWKLIVHVHHQFSPIKSYSMLLGNHNDTQQWYFRKKFSASSLPSRIFNNTKVMLEYVECAKTKCWYAWQYLCLLHSSCQANNAPKTYFISQ